MRNLTNQIEYLNLCNMIYVETNQHVSGGRTVNLQGVKPKGSFVVGVHSECTQVFDSYESFNNTDILAFIKKNKAYLSMSNLYVGSWLNPDNNKIYLNVSAVVQNRGMALNMARLHDQIAYYDIENDCSITV